MLQTILSRAFLLGDDGKIEDEGLRSQLANPPGFSK
jgi:hypothetical protein